MKSKTRLAGLKPLLLLVIIVLAARFNEVRGATLFFNEQSPLILRVNGVDYPAKFPDFWVLSLATLITTSEKVVIAGVFYFADRDSGSVNTLLIEGENLTVVSDDKSPFQVGFQGNPPGSPGYTIHSAGEQVFIGRMSDATSRYFEF